jgi:D-3-phosphoglycerate dehydrogenase
MEKILVTDPCFGESSDAMEVLTNRGYRPVRSPFPIKEQMLVRLIRDAQAVICGPDPVSAEAIEAASGLKIIARYGVGLDNVDIDAATKRKVIVTNAAGANSDAVADFVFCAMLSLARNIIEASKIVPDGRWQTVRGVEIFQKTLGVVGTGSIGRRVIRRATGFDMKVLAYDVVEDASLVEKFGVEYVALEELLKASDFVTLHVPVVPQTVGLIGEKQLALMKPTAYLINTARGKILDETALFRALKEKKIAGAALDVFTEEPPKTGELFFLPKVLTTPHIASSTDEAMRKVDQNCIENVTNVLSGKDPITPVNYPF